MITVLCGGVGGSRFLRALTSVVDARAHHGDHQHRRRRRGSTGCTSRPIPTSSRTRSPARSTRSAAGGCAATRSAGWSRCARFGHETWFQIGDRDLATHLHRTRLLREGRTLSAVMAEIARAFGVRVRLLPMSDDRVRTIVETDAGDLPFQRYLVERHAQDAVRGVRFDGAEAARPAPGVIEAMRAAEAIFIAPSNPIGSIGPILAVPGVREAIAASRRAARRRQPDHRRALAAAAGRRDDGGARVRGRRRGRRGDLRGPDRHARHRRGGCGATLARVEAAGVRAVVAPTVMRDDASRRALATLCWRAAGIDRARRRPARILTRDADDLVAPATVLADGHRASRAAMLSFGVERAC